MDGHWYKTIKTCAFIFTMPRPLVQCHIHTHGHKAICTVMQEKVCFTGPPKIKIYTSDVMFNSVP